MKALQPPLTDEGLTLVEQLIDQRAVVIDQTDRQFEPAFRADLQAEIKALLQQQRALEMQLVKVQGALRASSDQAGQARGAMEGVRRTLKTEPRSRWINQRV